jgi:dGTPase
MAGEERELKAFLYANMYRSPPLLAVQAEAKRVIADLFAAYRADPGLIPIQRRPADAPLIPTLRAISDFVAGMTDRYAITQHTQLIGPVELPEAF